MESPEDVSRTRKYEREGGILQVKVTTRKEWKCGQRLRAYIDIVNGCTNIPKMCIVRIIERVEEEGKAATSHYTNNSVLVLHRIPVGEFASREGSFELSSLLPSGGPVSHVLVVQFFDHIVDGQPGVIGGLTIEIPINIIPE